MLYEYSETGGVTMVLNWKFFERVKSFPKAYRSNVGSSDLMEKNLLKLSVPNETGAFEGAVQSK